MCGRRTSNAIYFFVSWVIVGKYIFLTLFLAVTLEAFESKYDVDTVSKVTTSCLCSRETTAGLMHRSLAR